MNLPSSRGFALDLVVSPGRLAPLEIPEMEPYISLAAAAIAAFALIVSFLSWRASVRSVRASAFNRRFEIYSDAERFLEAGCAMANPT